MSDPSMTDFAARRTMMVDTQVRPSDVTKYPIIDAMLNVAREAFVPQALQEAAYMGENLDLGEGRVLLEPRTFAKMLDALDVQPDELVLDVGAAYGYSAAVLSHIAQAVVALEVEETWSQESQDALSEAGIDAVVVEQGDLAAGAKDLGPYDVIMVQGGVATFPQALIDQLKDGGRAAALFVDGALGEVRIGYKRGDQMTWRMAFNAGAPLLPGFEREQMFSL